VDLTCASCHAFIDESALSANPDFNIQLIRARILVPIKEIYLGNDPMLIVERNSSLSDIGNSEVSSPFVDRMVVMDAPRRGGERGASYPLLDRAGKNSLLHGDEVRGDALEQAANRLLKPGRDIKACVHS
jgi:hypothetical protein